MNYGKTSIPVLYENNFCLILNKPPGLAVQGGKGIKVSLDSILSEKIRPRPLLVHRLDRDTSGTILVAKTKEAAALFSKIRVEKRYLALCSGPPEQYEGVINLALDLRESKTFYRLLSSGVIENVPVSLLELTLGTGRMHQIRRHLAMKNCPILGDDKYGDFSLNKSLRKATGLKFMLLHASRLVISSSPGLAPGGLDITAPLPEYFSDFIKGL
jgi:23S rRNA pseudouridine955/2504/2580 synthase